MKISKTFMDYFYVIFGNGFARFVSLLSTMIVARILGPDSYGVFMVFYAVMILTWQLPVAFDTSFVAYAKACGTKEEKRDVLQATIVVKMIYLVGAFVCCYPLSVFLATRCFHKPEAVWPIVAAIVAGASQTFLMTIASAFQEEERFGHFAALNAMWSLMICACLVGMYLVREHFSLAFVLSVYVAMSVLVGAWSFARLYRRVEGLSNFNMAVFRKAIIDQGKWVLGCAIAFYIFQRIDVFFVTSLFEFRTVGIYGVGAQLVMIVGLMTAAMASICLPRASVSIHSREAFRKFTVESIIVVVLVNLGILVLMVFAPLAVRIMYGAEFVEAAVILRILLVGWLFSVAFVPFSFVFYAVEDFSTRFVIEVVKLAAGVVLLYLLAPRYGPEGAAWAIALTLAGSTVLSFAVLGYRMKRTYRRVLKW